MTRTAVVILNFNGEKYLQQFLPSVIEWSEEAEIIVADNASTDNSVQLLRSNFQNVRVIELKKNHGYAGGYNEALSHVEAEYFVLLNSDVLVTKSWLNPLVQFMDANPEYAACQPKIKDFNFQDRFEYAGACGGFIDTLGYPYCRGRIFDTLEIDESQYDNQIDIFWASGACMIVRSKPFLDIGGFDVDFFAHMEEIDLCWRFRSIDLKIRAVPQSTVYHVGGGTLSKSSPFKTYLNFRNGLSLLVKNLPFHQLLLKLPIRILLDWIAMLRFLMIGQFTHAIAILRAHAGMILRIFKTLLKRKRNSSPPDSRIVIADYFLRGKKKYSDLQ